MKEITSYNNAKKELDIMNKRLLYLIDKHSAIYARYFGKTHRIVGDKIKAKYYDDKFADYISDVLPLMDEIESIQEDKKLLLEIIFSMEKSLKDLDGIQHKLFYKIVVDGKSPTRAVEAVAESEHMEVRNVWRYYKKMKQSLK